MRVIKMLVILGMAVILFNGISVRADDMSGREIMDKVKELQKAQDEQESLSMQLIDSKGRVREREITRYTMSDANDVSKILIRFHKPSDVAGTGLLTWEQRDRDDDQWVYLPAAGKRSKRIVSGNKKSKFMGTDFTYGDLRPENLDKYEYNLTGSEKIDGVDSFVVEAIPGKEEEKQDSGYSKRKLWVRKDIYFVIKKEYYDIKGKLEKAETQSSLKNVSGTIWRADSITMQDFNENHKTVLQSKDRKLNKGLPETMFTVQELEKGL